MVMETQTAAAGAVDARKSYGSDDAAVHALAGQVDRQFIGVDGPLRPRRSAGHLSSHTVDG
jgi:hypothetical protein